MELERWKKIEELFADAGQVPKDQQAEFLRQACQGDPALYTEVLSLLNVAETGRAFVDGAPIAASQERHALKPGDRLSSFEILALLGRGGMGEVYRARDLRLRRDVAIKVLPPGSTADRKRVADFHREAQAASALNHPNIVSLYDIGTDHGVSFLVSELVDGETLAQRLSRGPLSLAELIQIGAQIAEGLAAAHAAGVVHGDIKPGNIMLTGAGRVKVLDFGLARRDRAAVPDGTTVTLDTGPTASILGTPEYMSPEQVRGEPLDVRTDLFSFGVMLYEMATGRRPFQRKNTVSVLAAILGEAPVPPRQCSPDTPEALERIITKALEKDREVRYQQASQIGADLTQIRLDSDREPAHPVSRPGSPAGVSEGRRAGFSSLTRKIWALSALVVAAALSVGLFFLLSRRSPPPSAVMKEQRLTSNASDNPIWSAAISPDNKYLAYEDLAGIHVRLLSTREERLIPVPADAGNVSWSPPSWFPDGSQLLVNATKKDGSSSIWAVSLVGETFHELRPNSRVLDVSPDGTHFACMSGPEAHELWILSTEGDTPRRVLTVHGDESVGEVHWSPDGRRLAFLMSTGPGVEHASIETCDLTGAARTVVVPAGVAPYLFSWLADGRIVFARMHAEDPEGSNLWQIGIDNHTGAPIGSLKRITQWTESHIQTLTASADGKRLVLCRYAPRFQVFLGKLTAGGTRMDPPRPLTVDDSSHLPTAWTPDSKAVVYGSNREGTWGIFRQGIGAQSPEPVFKLPQEIKVARFSGDGEWMLVQDESHKVERLLRVAVAGGPPQLVLESPDIKYFACARTPGGPCVVLEGREDRKVLHVSAFDPVKGRGRDLRTVDRVLYYGALSPDGSTLALSRYNEAESHILLIALRGGPDREIKLKDWRTMTGIDWTADGTGLYAVSFPAAGRTLLHVDLNGQATVLWQGKGSSGALWPLASPDGRYLALLAIVATSNVWAVDGF